MGQIRRRDALRVAAGSVGASLAGCLASLDSSNPDEDGDLTADDSLEATVFQAGANPTQSRWGEDESRTGIVALLPSAMDAEAFATMVTQTEGDLDPLFASWVEETDFTDSVILGVQTVAPNACYEKVEVADLTVSTIESAAVGEPTEAITGTAEAVENVGDDDIRCAEVLRYPTAYVRVTGENLPSTAALTITDGWGGSSDERSTDPLIDPETLPGAVRPEGEPPAVPAPLECDEPFQRLSSAADEVAWGETVDAQHAVAFAMRVEAPGESAADTATDALAFERGDEVRIVARNISNRTLTTGNRRKYGFEVKTEVGWQDVRGTNPTRPIGHTDEGISHPPGEGFDWRFELTEDGLVDDAYSGQELRVCPALQSGRYRFRFWGVTGTSSLAVAFDVES